MNVIDAIKERYAVRNYQTKDVEEDKLKRVLGAARWAPSAYNRQEWRFVIVRDSSTRQKLTKTAHGQEFVGQAPVVIAACATDTSRIMPCGQVAYPIELAIAIDHMTLKAVEEGLGSCWIGDFEEDEVKKILDIPDQIRVVILLPLGYPVQAVSPSLPKKRKKLNEIVTYDKWR
ncbi:nitroreductase family protein [Candidatus Bipolaricaulota bacterium]|nr:nitroreductase family protein [Candidatus Bipolaricaulota bacterium]